MRSWQTYRSSCFAGTPAFLVYYSPAFVRRAASTDAAAGLKMLAEVYRQARSLWPLKKDNDQTVQIRIDQLKEHTPVSVLEGHTVGEAWLIIRKNELEAAVEQHPLYTLNFAANVSFRLLGFWRTEDGGEFEDLDELYMENLRGGGRLSHLEA